MSSFQEPAEVQPYASNNAASGMIFNGANAESCDNSSRPRLDVAGLAVEDTTLCRQSLQHLQVQQQVMQAQLSLILQQNHYGGAWSAMQPALEQPAVHRRRNRKGLKQRLRLRERATAELSTAEEATASDTHLVFDSSDGHERTDGGNVKSSLSRVALLHRFEGMQARLHAAEAEWTRAEQALLDRAEMAEQYAGVSEESIRQSSARVAELGQQIQESQDHASEQFTRACLLDSSLGDAMQRIGDLEATVGRGLGDLRAAEDKATVLQVQAETAEYRAQMAGERAETAEKRIVELERSWGRELGKVTALEAIVGDSAAHIEALQTELEQTQECLGQVELQRQIATAQVQQAMDDLDEAKQQTLRFQECAGSEVARAEVAESRVTELEERTAELEQHLVTAQTCAGSEVARAGTAEWRVAELEAAFSFSYVWEHGGHI